MKNETKKLWKSIGIGSFLITLMAIGVAVMLINSNISPNVTIEYREHKPLTLTWVGDNNPGSGASGFLMVVIASNGAKTWNSSYNASGVAADADIYGWAEVNNTHIDPDIPYDAAFEIAIKVRFNATHAQEGATWRMDWVNGWANCTDPNSCLDHTISSLECDEELIAKGDTYMWVWYVADHTDSNGYNQDRGCNTTGLTFNFNAYY